MTSLSSLQFFNKNQTNLAYHDFVKTHLDTHANTYTLTVNQALNNIEKNKL